MTTTAPTFGQIRAQIAAIKKYPGHAGARVFGIQSAARYNGESRYQLGDEVYEIVQCDSELAMRVALQDENADVTAKVLVTRLSTEQLSADIRVRLARRKLYPIKKWQIVKELFQARSLDPRIVDQIWIADRLLDLAPVGNYPPVSGGVLDAETVWSILLEKEIGLSVVHPDLIGLLKWSMDAGHVKRYCAQPEPFRHAAALWLAQSSGIATAAVLACLEKTQQPIPLTVGLALAVVVCPNAPAELKTAGIRIEERYLTAGKLSAPVAQQWQKAATDLVRLHLPDAKERREWLAKGDELLRAIEAEPWAYLSRTSPLGFEQRLDNYGTAVGAAADSRVTEIPIAVSAAYDTIVNHEQANWQRDDRRLQRIEMSARLLRWLAGQNSDGGYSGSGKIGQGFDSLGEAARWYATDGGFIDWARYVLQSGEPARKLADAYHKLVSKVIEIRGSQNHRFAELVRDWTAAGSTGSEVLPMERVLTEYVSPLAEHAPLLVLVIDGMSHAVFREMVGDITRQDWVEIRREDKQPIWSAIATLPSITEVSRTSLLCGELRQGNQGNEKVEFPKHEGLLANSLSSYPPVLFHKKELQSRNETSLSDEVIKAIESKRRVVGAVINAVDDFLDKGEQLDIRWTKDEIKVLPQLLYEAKSAKRMVVLLSDHGHILDRETTQDTHEGGARWRHDGNPKGRNLKSGEIVISGERCVVPNSENGAHSLIVPWSENIRYAGKKNGYHGGVTMQEMLAPMAVLSAREDLPEGWIEPPSDVPDWWFEPMATATKQDAHRDGMEVELEVKLEPHGLLFDKHGMQSGKSSSNSPSPAEAVPGTPAVGTDASPVQLATPDWVEKLFVSLVFAQQKTMAGRKPPSDDLIRKLLVALDGTGGKLTSVALARKMDVLPFRLSSILAAIQRVLNVEGYSILMKDDASDSIEFNRNLLCVQFGIQATGKEGIQ